jgi:anti-anti-sigma factor
MPSHPVPASPFDEDEILRTEVVPHRNTVRLALFGELDLSTIPNVEDQLRELHEAGFRSLVLDLRNLTFLDSSGIALILRWHRAMKRDRGSLALLAGPPAVHNVFELTGVGDILDFADPAEFS